MRVRSIRVQNYRSILNGDLPDCGDLNILVGKNNAGKSNFLSTIELVLAHLKQGTITSSWDTARPQDEFHQRKSSDVAVIQIEFDLPPRLNAELRNKIAAEAPHLEKSIEQITDANRISFTLNGTIEGRAAFLFVNTVAVFPSTDPSSVTNLLGVARPVAIELHNNLIAASALRSDLNLVERVVRESSSLQSYFDENRNRDIPLRYVLDRIGTTHASPVYPRLETLFRQAEGFEGFSNAVSQVAAELKEQVDSVEQREINGTLRAFAGETTRQPAYITWLMAEYGAIRLLQLKENKERIGPKEAQALLDLKLRRGGAQKLALVQQTVQALLGVRIDAFQPDRPSPRTERRAEMDVDEFLVEANGAGIRDALRLILDFELSNPSLVLVEEPEVHLHPGLARSLQHYLRDKSKTVQIFLTTHSTEFVDSVSFQNVYFVSRNPAGSSVCRAISSSESGLEIPAELGLRPSSIFMYDNLVFVEGVSDEEMIREIAAVLDLNVATSNVGFVHLGGVRNFAYFAAESTLSLLSKRQISLRFLVDRDEKDNDDVKKMAERLGDRATLHVLERRELENYLLAPAAIKKFVEYKRDLASLPEQEVSIREVQEALNDAALSLKADAIRLRLEKELLAPVYLNTRLNSGPV